MGVVAAAPPPPPTRMCDAKTPPPCRKLLLPPLLNGSMVERGVEREASGATSLVLKMRTALWEEPLGLSVSIRVRICCNCG